ncbi:MAG: hypothetical protein HZB41_08600 [Ignavibacteriae bacterium]|nr:hypothetical protein [Ignavibacteriota bacterium]
MSKLMAFAAPITEGKTQQWEQFANKLKNERKEEFRNSRNSLGVHERTFLQHTPMGDFVIVTLEGENPMEAYAKFCQSQDPFAQWFINEVKDVHGIDLSQAMPGPMPELILDSKS